jgi:SmpA / OmlA family
MRRSMNGCAAAICAALMLLLAACDQHKIEKLEEGVSTEAEVRTQFGEPESIFKDTDGGKTLEYTRQPEGTTNYFIGIGPDGKMTSLRQVLTPANFAKVLPGMDKSQVRRMLGKPAKVQTYKLKDQDVWDYRYVEASEKREFSITFDNQRKVISSASATDPRELQGGGK